MLRDYRGIQRSAERNQRVQRSIFSAPEEVNSVVALPKQMLPREQVSPILGLEQVSTVDQPEIAINSPRVHSNPKDTIQDILPSVPEANKNEKLILTAIKTIDSALEEEKSMLTSIHGLNWKTAAIATGATLASAGVAAYVGLTLRHPHVETLN